MSKWNRIKFAKVKSTYLSDGALDVSNNGSVRIVDELDSDLGHVTGVTSAAENFVHLSKLDGLILKEKSENRDTPVNQRFTQHQDTITKAFSPF